MNWFIVQCSYVLLVLGAALFGAACSPEYISKTDRNEQLSSPEPGRGDAFVRDIASKVQGKSTAWTVEEFRTTSDDLERTNFLDEMEGYGVSSPGKFLQTSDGGRTWRSLASQPNTVVNDLLVGPDGTGLAVGFTYDPASPNAERKGVILRTVDGGRNWLEVTSIDSANLERVTFSDGSAAWVAGRQNVGPPNADSVNFVMVSADRGQTWMDVSGALNDLVRNEQGWVGDYLTDIASTDERNMTFLTLRGRIVTSLDLGRTWKLVSQLGGEPDQTGIRNLGITEPTKYSIAGGTVSIEGKWSMVAHFNAAENAWTRYRLRDYYLADFAFLPNGGILACGSQVAANNFGGTDQGNIGVILYSTDDGENWGLVYQSSRFNGFSSIARLSASKYIVTGHNGSVISLVSASPTV